MPLKPSKYYTLPISSLYPNSYEPMVINFDHINNVRRDGTSLFIAMVVGYSHVMYTDAFEVDLLVRDLNNTREASTQSVSILQAIFIFWV